MIDRSKEFESKILQAYEDGEIAPTFVLAGDSGRFVARLKLMNGGNHISPRVNGKPFEFKRLSISEASSDLSEIYKYVYNNGFEGLFDKVSSMGYVEKDAAND